MSSPNTLASDRTSALRTDSATQAFLSPDYTTGGSWTGGGGGGSGGSGSGGSSGGGGTWGSSGGGSSGSSSAGSSWGSSWGGSSGGANDPQHPATGNTTNPYGSDPKHFEYDQSTGKLFLVDDKTGAKSQVGVGYSGNGSAINNPSDQGIANHGPIPQGSYTIGGLHNSTTTGPDSMNLSPSSSNNMDGRSGFLMHGDNSQSNFTASDGCIIMTKAVRDFVGNSGVTNLQVVQ